jgi:hypothetical protein
MKIMKTMNKYLLFALVVLGSCYTPNKANKALNKANDKFPDIVAKFTRDKYPCITKSLDTTYRIDTAYEYIDVDCPDYKDSVVIRDTIKSVTIFPRTVTKKVKVAVPQQTQIINHYIEDSAKIKIMTSENIKCSDELKDKTEQSANRLKWIWWLIIALIISIFVNYLQFRRIL